jgi:F0F1-type ATP synthase assembly protein I
MSESDTVAASAEGAQKASQKPPPPRFDNRTLAILLVVGAIVGAVASLTADRVVPTGPWGLQTVASAELENALLSMDPSASAQAAEEARRCKTPLAYVTLQAEPGPTPVTVRIRSGGYVSAPISLSDAPRRVAIPFPAPYPTGRGELFLEGAQRSVKIWLNPGRVVGSNPASAHIPVMWTPINPC